MANTKGDLFGFFNAINRQDYEHVNQMEDDEVKALSPFVINMWMSGAKQNTEIHTILTDAYVNPYIFRLSKHPRLLLKMFIASNGGIDNTRYSFKKSVTKEESTLINMVAEYYNMGYNHAKDVLRLLSIDDVKELKELYAT